MFLRFEDVSAEVEWEARRVAAAFDVKEFEARPEDWLMTFIGQSGGTQMRWNIDARTNAFFYIEVGGWGL